MVSRLAVQKGIELMFESLPQVLAARASLGCALLGSGEPQYEEFFTGLAAQLPRPRALSLRL